MIGIADWVSGYGQYSGFDRLANVSDSTKMMCADHGTKMRPVGSAAGQW